LLYGIFVLTSCVADGGEQESHTGEIGPAVPTPRLISPMSTTHVTTKLPTLTWELRRPAQRARVEICVDRGCTDVLYTFEVRGTAVRPEVQLPDGVLYWRVTALGPHGSVSAPSATWEFWTSGMFFPQPGLAGPPADTWYSSVLDVNGDGYADLAIGAPGAAAGFVHIYLGGPAGPPEAPTQTVEGAPFFGATLASAGDVDGDGYADLAVTTGIGGGTVQVLYGDAQGLSTRSTTLSAGRVTAMLGASLAPALDVNRDGYGDLLVGGLEVANVYLGGPDGIATAPTYELQGDDAADPTIPPNAMRVSSGGDVNGDRVPDAMVNGWSYLGTGNGFAREGGNRFLDGEYVGDVNGDGLCDYAGYTVHPGSTSGLASSDIMGAAGFYFFTTPGDTNGDGFNEVITAISSITGIPESWRVYYGNPLNCTCGPETAISFPGASPPFSGFTAAGDLNGDTLEDLAVGVAADGAVYLFMAPDVPTTPTRALTGTDEGFGTAVE